MDDPVLAYCAGVIDSDGCITIKSRRTPTGRTFASSLFVRQVEPEAINVLRQQFGGPVRVHGPSTPGGRDLFHWELERRSAVAAVRRLIPYLRIKRRQALIILEFAEFLGRIELRRLSTHFVFRPEDEFYTPAEAAVTKGMLRACVYQCVSDGTVPVKRIGRRVLIPKRFWDSYQIRSGTHALAPEYVTMRQEFVTRIRSLNGPTRGIRTSDRVA